MSGERPTARVAAALDAAAKVHRLEPALVRAVAFVESRFNPTAISNKGARGLLQLMPDTAKALGVLDAFDPVQNATGGAKYLAALITKYTSLERALAAYNWGPGNLDKSDRVPEQVATYVARVLERLTVERKGGGAPPPPLPAATAPAVLTERARCSLRCPYCSALLELELAGVAE